MLITLHLESLIVLLNIKLDLETHNGTLPQALKLKLSWKNLNYSVRVKYTKVEKDNLQTKDKYYEKQIIKNASGFVDQGDALFIMGSSGAGKTTLLNILADQVNRPSKSKLDGEVLLNDSMKITSDNFGAYAAYVLQDDFLFPSFTCEQSIQFAANLRLNLNDEDTQVVVDDIINELSLNKCRKTIIGNEQIKGLSGGERKRTSIAVEMVSNPKILFLDEPTSGLDSFTANKIVKLLVKFAEEGKTVIATIHQPSSGTFKLFPSLLLMMDGNTIYHGSSMESVDYFKQAGYMVPEYSNPADYYLKAFYIPFNRTIEDDAKVESLTNSYTNEISPKITEENNKIRYPNINQKELFASMVKVNWFVEFWLLFKRAARTYLLHPMALQYKAMAYTVLALVSLALFWDLGDSEQDVRSKIGATFFILAVFTYDPVYSSLMTFTSERAVFLKEYMNKTYGLLPYAISKSIIEMPFEALAAGYFSTIVYFGMGFQRDFEHYIVFTAAMMVNSVVATSIGLTIGSAITNGDTAVQSIDSIVAPFVVFSGLPVNVNSIYIWLRWVQYLSPMRYSMEILVRNEFSDRNLSPDPVDTLNFNIGTRNCFIILFVFILAFRILAIMLLKLTAKR